MAVNAVSKINFIVSRVFKYKLKVTNADGTIRNLTGYDAKMDIKRTREDATPYVVLTSNPPAGLTITPLDGEIDIKIDEVASALILSRSAVYDILIDNGNPDGIEHLAEGGIIMRHTITTPS